MALVLRHREAESEQRFGGCLQHAARLKRRTIPVDEVAQKGTEFAVACIGRAQHAADIAAFQITYVCQREILSAGARGHIQTQTAVPQRGASRRTAGRGNQLTTHGIAVRTARGIARALHRLHAGNAPEIGNIRHQLRAQFTQYGVDGRVGGKCQRRGR